MGEKNKPKEGKEEQTNDALVADINYDAINADHFKDIKYQDLLKEFENLGIASAWKPGKPATYMVKIALEKIALLKELKANGIEGEKASDMADTAIKVKEVQQKAQVKAVVAEDQETTKQAREKELKRIKGLNVSPDNLQLALNNTNANLRNNPSEAQRAILLMKQSVLMEVLEDK